MNVTFEPVSGATAPAARDLILAGLAERFGTLRTEFLDDVLGLPGSYAPPRLLLVGVAQGKVVCTGALVPESAGLWRIQRMSVLAEMRRLGLARAALHALEQAARGRGARALILETTADWASARRLYESAGFRFQTLEEQVFADGGGNTVAHYFKELP